MTGRVLYLAAPIDQAQGMSKVMADRAAEAATEARWAVYRPDRAWRVPTKGEPFGELEQINRSALERSDAMLAILPPGTPSVGVPREIEYAKARGIPVRILHDDDEVPRWSLADIECVGQGQGITTWLRGLSLQLEADVASNRILSSSAGQAEPFVVYEDRVLDLRPHIRFHVGAEGFRPTRFFDGDAGWDLYTSESIRIPPQGFQDIPTRVRVALPDGVWARICGRSSTFRKLRLQVVEGVIDTGYRGELYIGVQNFDRYSINLGREERIAQLIPHQNLSPGLADRQVDWAEFSKIPQQDDRGEQGRGSTS